MAHLYSVKFIGNTIEVSEQTYNTLIPLSRHHYNYIDHTNLRIHTLILKKRFNHKIFKKVVKIWENEKVNYEKYDKAKLENIIEIASYLKIKNFPYNIIQSYINKK